MKNFFTKSLILFIVVHIGACNVENKTTHVGNESNVPLINYGVVATYPHDNTSYTEGLVIHAGKLYEGTGSPEDLPHTKSIVGAIDLTTGEIEKKVELDRNKYFGEGIVFLNQKLYQLTYITKVGFIYHAQTFKPIGEFTFPSKEGWGLTTDGTHLIMSDGTDKLTYLDSASLKRTKTISVHEKGLPVKGVNELEYIQGFIYANIFNADYILKIDPNTGALVGKIDLTSLAQDARARNKNSLDLNGIAYDANKGTAYVTGKFWPAIYEIKFNLASK